MKHLKKLFVLTCIVLTAFACDVDDEGDFSTSSHIDDEQGTVVIDDIVGNWHLVKDTYIYDGDKESYDAECDTEKVLVITNQDFVDKWDDYCDGTFDYSNPSIQYSIVDLNGNPYNIIQSGTDYVIGIILRLEGDTLILKQEYIDPDTQEIEISLEQFSRN